MTVRRMLGIVLIVLGSWPLLNEPMTYWMREKRSIPFVLVFGAISIITGAVILITSVRDRS
jgi:hypothetical protein